MKSMEILQKDPLWIKACDLSRNIISIVDRLDQQDVQEFSQRLELFIHTLPRKVAQAVLASNSQTQTTQLQEAVDEARKADDYLQELAAIALAAGKLDQDKSFSQFMLDTFRIADQLREMIFLTRNELEEIRITA